MAALINALDNYTPLQKGEKGHSEYGWSNSTRESILQLSFQLTRSSSVGQLKRVTEKTQELLQFLSTMPQEQEKDELLITFYKMIGHTRDIIDGKGEYNLTYMLILAWYDHYPECAMYALESCVCPENDEHSYGSWKDIKYFCNFCKEQTKDPEHPLIQHAIHLLNRQIQVDNLSTDKSLAAKWAPHETSGKFGWLFEPLACDYFANYLQTAWNGDTRIKAKKKAKMEYRKLCSTLNKILDTTQIKQCNGTWSAINFDHVTSITMAKQKKAFLNKKISGKVRCEDNEDRIKCAEHLIEHIEKATTGEKQVKGKRVSMVDFTKQALLLNAQKYDSNIQIEKDLLNSQWRDNASQNGALGPMICMVDVSGSMTSDDALNVAIALGCRIAEKSLLGKRVMTFNAVPKWVNLDGADTFTDMVQIISKAPWGMNTNFYAALDMILESIVKNKMAVDLVETMILTVLSDMQMDQASKNIELGGTLYENMEKKYADAGIRVHGIPYKPPHILFWNLRSTNGFPSLSSQKNVSMISGFSPTILNLFCDKGIDALQSCTPWSQLKSMLDNARYDRLQTFFMNDKLVI